MASKRVEELPQRDGKAIGDADYAAAQVSRRHGAAIALTSVLNFDKPAEHNLMRRYPTLDLRWLESSV
jgi:hypothetical protein